jgi:hypothetical protein
MRRRHSITAIAATALAVAAPAAAAPKVDQLVVAADGTADQQRVKAPATRVPVGGKRCGVAAATPLAALVESGVGPLRFRDYGSCSRRAADSAGLYVRSIAGDRAKGRKGWVYKVGNKVGTAGAADPAGPFGRGRLKAGTRVTWFFCTLRGGGCQRTLGVKPRALGGGEVQVTVRAYDDFGRGKLVKGATVHADDATAATNGRGRATLQLDPGEAAVWASAKGRVRSFEEAVDVR